MRSQVSRRRRALGLASLVGCLSLTLMLSGVPAEAAKAVAQSDATAASPVAGDPVQVLQRPDPVSAMVTARASGERVEDLSQRTEESQVFANPDGTWTSESAPDPVRVQDAEGGWHDIDTKLVERDGGFAPAYAASDLMLSDGGDRTFAQLTAKGHDLAWKWTQDLPAPVVKGNTATYRGVAPGNGDLVVTATPTGFSYDVVLHQAPTEPVDLTSPVVTDGAQIQQTAADGVEISTPAGKVVAAAPHPMMWDAQVDAQGEPVNVQPVATDVATTASGGRVSLSPDQGFLTDPSTQYPVVVDPSFTTKTTGDMWIENIDNTSAMPGTDYLRVGSQDGGTHKYRTYLDFKNSDATSRWNGTHVTSATLRFWNFHSGSCAAGAIRASAVTSDWATANLSWGNQPTVSGSLYDDYAAAHGNTNCDPDDADFNVTSIVNAWANGTIPNRGIRVKAVDETSSNTFREYRSVNYDLHPDWQPKLIFNYNHYPSTPGTPTVTTSPASSAGYSRSVTPTLKATVSDPDASSVRGIFEVYQGASWKWTGTSAYVSSGATATVTVPSTAGLVNGGTYTVKVKANDGTDDSKAYSASTTFTVDTTSPTMASGDVTATAFTNGQWRTDIPGSNTFTFNGPADTKSFTYTLDGLTQPVKSANTAGDASISWLPKSGSHKLTVQATDKAGNPGNTVTFTFGIGPASFLVPNASARSTGVFPVQASGPPNAIGASLSWRYAGTSTWKTADGVTKNGAAWSGAVSNASDGSASLSGSLLWDATGQVEDKNATPQKTIAAPALIELRTCFNYASTPSQVCSAARPVQLVPSAFGGTFPTTDLGPAHVALFTGEMTFTEPDAVDTAAGTGRTFSSFDPATTQAGAFGPGWSTALLAPGDASAELVDNRTKDGTFVLVTAGNASQSFTAVDPAADVVNPTGPIEFQPVGTDDGSRLKLDGATVTLTRPQAATTSWALQDGDWQIQDADADDDTTDTPQTSFSQSASGELTWIAQTEPGTSATCTAIEQTPGCRGLKISYDGTGSLRRVSKIELVTSESTTELASYTYSSDATGRILQSVCGQDPDDSGPLTKLCASYTYTTVSGRTLIATATPPGQAAWQFGYDSTGRLTTVRRALDPNTNTGTGTATWTVRYDLAPTASGLPDMTAASIARWGQQTVPTKVYAVFDPSDPNTTDLTYADLYYTDDDGTTTNTAVHGNADGVSQWLVDTAWYDENDNVVQTLDGAGRARALTATTLAEQQAAAEDASSFTVYNTTGDTASADTADETDGRRVEDEYGPVHTVTLKDGTSGPYRSHTAYVYDDEDTTLGGGSKPPLDEGQEAFDLVVEERHSATDPERTNDFDTTVVRYDYDPAVAGDGNGWELGVPTRTKVQLADGAWSTTVDRYDTEGRLIETRQPGGATNADGSGADAHATVMSYYAAGQAVDPDCRTDATDHPERKPWIGLPCKTGPAGNAQLTPPMPVTYYAAYNDDLQPTKVEETSGNTTRATTTTYDKMGRVLTTTVTDGSDTRSTTQAYDPTTALPTGQTNDADSVTTRYDTWGRPWKYTDATGMVSTTTYTNDGQIATRDDGVGVYTYSYDIATGEHRRLPNTVDVGLPAGTPDIFNLSYDSAGAQTSVAYPNGMTAKYGYDEAGMPTSLQYTDGTGQNMLSFENTVDVDGRVLAAGSDASHQDYAYDALGRLTKVEDTRDGQCTTRTYGFSGASERTAFHSYNADADGNCQTTTAAVSKANTYDAANRIRNAGYSYDDLGRALTVPAADTAAGAASDLALSYYANDMVKSMTQSVDNGTGGTIAKETSYALDATGRIDSLTNRTGSTEDSRLRYRFSDSSDAPSSIQTSTDAGSTWTTTRYLALPGMGMVGTQSGGSIEYQIANLHGDVVATGNLQSGTAAIESFGEADEYGNQSGPVSSRYRWLGAQQRSNDALGGLQLMGARLYNPKTGSFLQCDPILGGGATQYGFPYDPVNISDLSGESWELMTTRTSQLVSTSHLRQLGHEWIDVASALGSGVTKRITAAIKWINKHAEVTLFGFGISLPILGKVLSKLSVVVEAIGGVSFAVNLLDRTGRAMIRAANQSSSGYGQFILQTYGAGFLRKHNLGVQAYNRVCGGRINHILTWYGSGSTWV